MPTYRHLVRMPFTTGLPKDVAINVFHSISDNDAAAMLFVADLLIFYAAVDGLMSNQFQSTGAASSVTTYNLADPEPRAPIDITTFNLTPNTSTLPLEVALGISFQGVKVSGEPQSRRRGRIFLGPLGGIQDSTTGRPNSANVTTIKDAADALLTASKGAATYSWAVYSPTDQAAVAVDNGWIDNEFDTVRHRGRSATTRQIFS